MRNKFVFAALILLVIAGLSCKKQIEKAKTDAVIDVMVAHKWIVLQYMEGTNNVTSEFAGYDFQFNRDNTVIGADSINRGTGTWSGNAATASIMANFAAGTQPLTRLNGTWSIYYYDSNGPKFSQIINGVEMKLVLREK